MTINSDFQKNNVIEEEDMWTSSYDIFSYLGREMG